MTTVPEDYALTSFEVMEPDCTRDNDWFYDFWRMHAIPVDDSFAIETRTGIHSRPYFCPERSVVDIAAEMVCRLRRTAEIVDGANCDSFLLVSSRADVEEVARVVGERLALPGQGINWACSGFPGAIRQLVRDAGRDFGRDGPSYFDHHQRIVIWLEVWRDMLNLCNFRVAPLFGDCCVGARFTSCRAPAARFAIRDAFARRIGIDRPAIWLNHCSDGVEHCRDPYTGKERCRNVFDADGRPYNGIAIDMDGRMIFREAPRRMINIAEEGLQRCRLRFEDVADLLPHSANERMRPGMAELINSRGYHRLTVDGPLWHETDIHMDMKRQGNPGSGAIPLKLQRRQDLYRPGNIIVAPAVGAGRSISNWEAAVDNDDILRQDHQRGELTEGNVVLRVI